MSEHSVRFDEKNKALESMSNIFTSLDNKIEVDHEHRSSPPTLAALRTGDEDTDTRDCSLVIIVREDKLIPVRDELESMGVILTSLDATIRSVYSVFLAVGGDPHA